MSSTGLAPATLEAASQVPATAHVLWHRRQSRAGSVRAPRLARFAAFLLGTVWLVIVLVPIYYMVLASFRTQGQYLTGDPWLPTGGLSLSSYRTVLSATGIGVDFRNSAILTLASIVIVVVFSLVQLIGTHSSDLGNATARAVVLGGLITLASGILLAFHLQRGVVLTQGESTNPSRSK